MRGMILAVVIAATAVSAGAASAPIQPDVTFDVGKASAADVTAKLGKPTSVSRSSDGTTTLVYYAIRAHAKGTAFIPIVGMFAGGAKSSLKYKIFTFGADGLLKTFTSSETNADCSGGIQGVNCR